MRKLTYALLIILLAALLAACAEVEQPCECATATPTQEVATWTPEPNVTLEPTLRPDEGTFNTPLNYNSYEMWVRGVEAPYPGVDGRFQCQPQAGEFLWQPRPVEGGLTPPYVQCDTDNDATNADGDKYIGGVHYVEIPQIAGEYTWRLYDPIYVYAGHCYLVKLIGYNQTAREAGKQNELFGIARIYEDDVLVGEASAPFTGGFAVDMFFPVRPSHDAIIEIEAGFSVNHAVYLAESTVQIDEIPFIQPLDGGAFCELDDTIEW